MYENYFSENNSVKIKDEVTTYLKLRAHPCP